MEGALHRAGGGGLQAVVRQDSGDGKGGFDLGDGHRRGLRSVFCSTEKKNLTNEAITQS